MLCGHIWMSQRVCMGERVCMRFKCDLFDQDAEAKGDFKWAQTLRMQVAK